MQAEKKAVTFGLIADTHIPDHAQLLPFSSDRWSQV